MNKRKPFLRTIITMFLQLPDIFIKNLYIMSSKIKSVYMKLVR